eukprot:6477294-Amphidinium_carterae.1
MGLARRDDLVLSPLCAANLRIDTQETRAAFAHNFREVVRAHHLAALERRRPNEFTGCDSELHLGWIRNSLTNARTKPQFSALMRLYSGAFLCRERHSRHEGKGNISPLCSICGELDTVEHIVAECPGVPCEHRAYLAKITCQETKTLLIRTGLPQATPEISDLGEKEYAKFAHLLAASLVKRNMLNAEMEEKALPVKRRLRGKQPPPRAFVLARQVLAKTIKKPKRGPNLRQRAQMEYSLDEEGKWHVGGHAVRPLSTGATPSLRCDVCLKTSAWHLKWLYMSCACDGRQRTVHKNHLGSAPKHIEISKGELRCKVCGQTRSTKHSAHFMKKHGKCV